MTGPSASDVAAARLAVKLRARRGAEISDGLRRLSEATPDPAATPNPLRLLQLEVDGLREENDRLRRVLARVLSRADAWERHQPTLNTDAVVETIRRDILDTPDGQP